MIALGLLLGLQNTGGLPAWCVRSAFQLQFWDILDLTKLEVPIAGLARHVNAGCSTPSKIGT